MDESPPRLARAMWKRFALAGVLIACLTAAATTTAVIMAASNVADELAKGRLPNTGNELTRADVGGPQTIMVLGSDHRATDPGTTGNSDTIMLIGLDPDRSATALMSIPRDLRTDIPMLDGTYRYGQKINAAYAIGGPRLALRTVKRVLGIPINHVIDLDFKGFRHAVDRVGCIYTDVDRRYYHSNADGGDLYAGIDIQPGYQKLCDFNALAYVRYRHTDTDIVRGARQQDFLREAKDQLSAQKLFDNRDALVRIFARYADTDIRGTSTVLDLAKLVAFSAGHPIREVHFRAELGPSYVTATAADISANVREFLNQDVARSAIARPRLPSRPRSRRRLSRRALPGGIERASSDGELQAIQAAGRLGFPVYYPTAQTAGAVFDQRVRTYIIRDLSGRRHWAYRMVLDRGTLGDFYGVEGMRWRDPPLLAHSSGNIALGGRTFLLFSDGGRLRFVGWRTPRGAYWISNTLTLALNNDQMLAIAASTREIGR